MSQLNIDQILERVRTEAESLELPEYPEPVRLDTFEGEAQGPRDLPTPGGNQSVHIQSLLLAPRENFVQEAYRAILGREADSEGRSHQLTLLADGHSRTEVAYALACSPEGRARGVRLEGLGWRTLLCRWSLKLRRFSPQRIHAALQAGRGGPLGRFAQLMPSWMLRWFLLPFRLNRLPGRWLRSWESQLAAPYAFVGRLALELEQLQAHIDSQLEEQQQRIVQRDAYVDSQLEEQQQRILQRDVSIDSQLETHRQSLVNLEKTLDWMRYSISRRWHRALENAPLPAALPPKEPMTAERETLDAFYIAFEDGCRGSETDIREGLRIYLDYVRHSAAGQGLPLLDLGCGRGEWLHILEEEGFTARGVDQSPAMVERARAYGLDVEQGDAVAMLADLPEASLGGVSGFHIIEHLPFPVLFRLFAEVARVLAPGGIVIFETPNPENILVGGHTFYHDPTHRNPITPTLATFLAQYHGLAGSEILRLHPYPESARLPGDDPVSERINGLLCGPQDFALVAYRPRPV